MRVPETNATARTTAVRVGARRRRLKSTSGLQVTQGPQHRIRVRLVDVVDDAPVGEQDGPVGVAGGDRVVGDHDAGLAELADAAPQEVEHAGAGARVEVSGRL